MRDILEKLDGAWEETFKANLMHYCDLAAQEIRRLRKQGDPIAWFHPLKGGGIQVTSSPDTAQMWRENGADVQPLYRSPLSPFQERSEAAK